MQIITSVQELRAALANLRAQGTVGLVPTMGFLHEGHRSLIAVAKAHARFAVVSIFVNPTQFNDANDYQRYPVDLKRDIALLEEDSVALLFAPPREAIYPGTMEGMRSWVNVEDLSTMHEGEFRPGHFRGVTTVVSILFNLLQPDIAVFGEKDFQQLRIIERMVEQLHIPVQIIRSPLVRSADGLALSSRNARLSPEEHKAALLLSKGLFAARETFAKGNRKASLLVEKVREVVASSSLVIPEYVRIIEEKDLREVSDAEPGNRIIIAARVGAVRLIDNTML